MSFLADRFYIGGHGFELAKPNGFVPVAISTLTFFYLPEPLKHTGPQIAGDVLALHALTYDKQKSFVFSVSST